MCLKRTSVTAIVGAIAAMAIGGLSVRGWSGASAPGAPFEGAKPMAFIATSDGERSREFYEGVLGFEVVRDDDLALVLESGGILVQVQKVEGHEPPRFTALGWEVADIEAIAAALDRAGVGLERYEWMREQDDSRIATFGGGARVAWFLDPDGNILSIAEGVR